MRHMMLNTMEDSLQSFGVGIKRARQRFPNPRKLCQHFDSLARKGRHTRRIEQFRSQPRIRIPRHRYMVHVRQRQPRFFQAIANRRCRKSCRVLYAIESLLLDRRD